MIQLKHTNTVLIAATVNLFLFSSCNPGQQLEQEQTLLQHSRDSLQQQLDSIRSKDESIHYIGMPLYEPYPIILEPRMDDKWH